MNHPFPSARRWLCVAAAFVSFAVRAQNITDAYVSAIGVSWVGAVNDPVVILGSGFAPGNVPNIASVKFNGVAAGFSVQSGSQINITGIPVGATTGLITISNTLGVNFTSPQVFQVVGAGPYITGFNPVAGASTTVLLTGIRFNNVAGTNGVLFNGKKPVALLSQTATAMQVVTPPDVTTGPITIMASTGIIGTNTTSSNYYGPAVITSFNPSSGRAGTNVLIKGTNFTGATSVLFNGTLADYTVNSNTQITATVPANATTGKITVTAPGGGSVSVTNFVVLPTITSFAPPFGPVGTRVTINGANFIGSPTVRFNGVNGTGVSVTNSTLLGVTVPSSATSGFITITTTDGTATSLTRFYLPPRITGFSPTNSAPGTTVTLTGTNFTDATSLSFNGVTATMFNISSNSLQATVPADFTTGPLTLITPGGTNSTASLAQSNFYAAPIITSFSPVHGLPGTNVVIFGTNFLGATQVTFNGAAGATLIVSNNNAARITVPGAANTGPIALTAPAGTATSAATFYLDYPPVLTISTSTPPQLVLSWPGTFYTYTLQTNANLGNSNAWANIPTAPVVIGGSNFVTETSLDLMLFYRLKR